MKRNCSNIKKWYTVKAMCKNFRLAYSTILSYKNGNTVEQRLYKILMLTYFAQHQNLNENDIALMQKMFQKKVKDETSLQIKVNKTVEYIKQKYKQIDTKFLAFAATLYKLNLTEKELDVAHFILQNQKKGGQNHE